MKSRSEEESNDQFVQLAAFTPGYLDIKPKTLNRVNDHGLEPVRLSCCNLSLFLAAGFRV